MSNQHLTQEGSRTIYALISNDNGNRIQALVADYGVTRMRGLIMMGIE